MTIFLPLIYLLAGWLIGKTPCNIQNTASLLLTRVIIPLVIIVNIATEFTHMRSIILITMLCMLIMLAVGRLMRWDSVKNLCSCYLNIGWLGLPIASTLFGNDAATIIIAAYVGSSIVGNSVGAALFTFLQFEIHKVYKKPLL